MSSIISAWSDFFSNCKSLKVSADFWFNKISSEFNIVKISNPLLSDIDLEILNAANVVAVASNDQKTDIKTFFYYADSAVNAIKALNTLKQYFPEIPVVGFQVFQRIARLKLPFLNTNMALVLQLPGDGVHIFHPNRNNRKNPFNNVNKNARDGLHLWDDAIVTSVAIPGKLFFCFEASVVSLMVKNCTDHILEIDDIKAANGRYFEDVILNSCNSRKFCQMLFKG